MSRNLCRALVGLTVAGLAFAASADVFRCTDAAGRVEYRDSTCEGAVGSRKLDLAPLGPSVDAEMGRARIARESAEFNERFDRQMATRAALRAAFYYPEAYPGQFFAAQADEPYYYGYAGTVVPRERVQRSRLPIKTKPVSTIPAPRSPLMKR
jgi:hypothetical protein